MNWNQIEGQWNQITEQLKAQWGKLTEEDLKSVAGKRDPFIGKVVERYGIMKSDAEKQVNEWVNKFTPARAVTEIKTAPKQP